MKIQLVTIIGAYIACSSYGQTLAKVPKGPTADPQWSCITLQETVLVEGAATWKTENCTMSPDEPFLLTVNSVRVDLTSGKVRAVPGVADPAIMLQGIPDMAAPNPNLIAGINGGYFWRVDITPFWVDDVCRKKTRKEALSPVDPAYPNYGVGDGLIKIDGVVKSNNCNCTGYSRPAVLALGGIKSTIEVLYRGETVDDSVANAIGAGPNLVSFDASTMQSYIDIPEDDDNINIYEHAANTAVGLIYSDATKKETNTLLFVTTDGSDECGPLDYTCGLNSRNLASLMKDYFKSSMAMSMDQGGSTTMWVKGANPERNGVVSRSHSDEPAINDGPRSVANGLFIEIVA